jgi:hypothetical protein
MASTRSARCGAAAAATGAAARRRLRSARAAARHAGCATPAGCADSGADIARPAAHENTRARPRKNVLGGGL